MMKPRRRRWQVLLALSCLAAIGALAMAHRRFAPEEPARRTVAILLFEGVELLDFAGPAEVFIVASEGKAFRVVTVAASTDPLRTMGGVTVKPDFTFASAPRADIVVVPGGDMQ